MATLGDFTAGDSIFFNFTSLDIAASPAVPINTTGVTVSVYRDDGATESTDGVTYTTGFDSKVGLNNVKINTASNGTFYAAGHSFQAIITAGTANGVTLTSYVLASWTLQADAAYTKATAVPGLTWEEALASHTNTGTAGKKLGDLSTGSAPSAATVAAAVWEETHASHTNSGTFGNYVDAQISLTAQQTTLNAVSNAIALTPGLVWEEALASHTNTGTTGEKLGGISGGSTPGDIANAVWTAVIAEVSNDADLRSDIGKMVRGLFERFFNKVTQTSTLRTHYKDDGTNTFATMPVTDDGTTQSQGPSS